MFLSLRSDFLQMLIFMNQGLRKFLLNIGQFIYKALTRGLIDQQNRALEAATVTLRYSTALCPPMGKT